jgi:hypothetical protein
MRKLQWRELSSMKKTLIVVMAVVQIVLLVSALWDIARRSEDQIRGSKWFWRIISFVNFVGPLSYFRFGRTSNGAVVGR